MPSEALRAKAQRGSKLVRVVLTELLLSTARRGASDTGLRGEELPLWAARLRQQLNRGSFGPGHLKWQLELEIHHIP